MGVANHSGEYDSGHYTATCRVGGTSAGTWHHFCDHKVTKFSGKSVVTRDSYAIFLIQSQPSKTAIQTPKRQSLLEPENWPHPPETATMVLKAFSEESKSPNKSPQSKRKSIGPKPKGKGNSSPQKRQRTLDFFVRKAATINGGA